MKRKILSVMLIAVVLGTAGCGTNGAKSDSTVAISENTSAITGTWQTASMGYEEDGNIQPEYYVQFTDSCINYGHMKNGEFDLDHSDEIRLLKNIDEDRYLVHAESLSGTQYTYLTSEEDADILEYYETWNEADFPDFYRGGASLSRSR